MPDILVRDLDPQVVRRLKNIAKKHGRSLQGEVRAILADAAVYTMQEASLISEQWQKYFKGRKFSDSTESIREDRDR